MTKQLLIYENVVAINHEAHRKTSVKPVDTFAFAAALNTVPLVDAEIARATAEMPVLFAKTDTGVLPLGLLGIDQDKNSFVGTDGTWTGRYIPAFFRRYPYVFAAQDGADTMTLCVDQGYKGLNENDLGERMFDGEGNQTTYIRSVLQFAQDYQTAFLRTQALCKRIEDADILEDARINYTRPDGQPSGVTGFMRVNEEKLRALPDDKVLELFRAGDLAMIHAHLISLGQVDAVVAQSLKASAT